jgi:5-oxoprolinase (ATP-hydrolysing)
VWVLQEPDLVALRCELQRIFDATAIRSVAIVFMHAYAYPDHERAVGQLAKEIGFTQVSVRAFSLPRNLTFTSADLFCLCSLITFLWSRSLLATFFNSTDPQLSSELMPMVKIVPRAYTTCVDAYLTPCIRKYLNTFQAGFDERLFQRVQVNFMQVQ